MFERLEQIEAKYDELTQALASPDIVSDSQRYQKTAKAHSEIAPIVEKYREYKDLTRGIAESKAMLEDETDPEMLAYAQDELTQLEKRVARGRGRTEGPAAAQGSERREERHPGNPRRHRRRRGDAVRGRDVPHVQPLRRDQALEGGSALQFRVGRRRTEGSHRHHRRPTRVFAAEVRERRASRAARAADGDARSRSHLGGHRCCAARSRRRGHQDRGERHPHRYLLFVRSGRTVGEHDVLGGAHHALADEHGSELPGREVADQEPRKGNARAARPSLRDGAAEAG